MFFSPLHPSVTHYRRNYAFTCTSALL